MLHVSPFNLPFIHDLTRSIAEVHVPAAPAEAKARIGKRASPSPYVMSNFFCRNQQRSERDVVTGHQNHHSSVFLSRG
jgi:hypothetical protein